MANILVIDDDADICALLCRVMEKEGHHPMGAQTMRQGLELARENAFDLVLLDLHLPDGYGLDALPDLRNTPSQPEIIIITGQRDTRGAEIAFDSGAWDYVQKPFSLSDLMLPLVRALQYREEKSARQKPLLLNRSAIVGHSPGLQACLELVAQAAASEAPVLISGETGTGKELAARAIYENSKRSKGNFVVVDCTSIPENLVASTLFGHKKGSYTGAERDHKGLVQQAHGGVLFLDEVGELPLSIQKSFLRVLQERSFRPVGGDEEIKSDFRVVAATNRDLEEQIKAGDFREDLYFRLKALHIALPPLRERIDDIRTLVVYRIDQLCDRYGMETKGFSPEFLDALQHYSWPGNVRELFNVLERALASAGQTPTLYPMHLPTKLRMEQIGGIASPPEQEECKEDDLLDSGEMPSLKDYREQALNAVEYKYLSKLLKQTQGNVKEACRIAEMSTSRFYDLLKKHNLSPKQIG